MHIRLGLGITYVALHYGVALLVGDDVSMKLLRVAGHFNAQVDQSHGVVMAWTPRAGSSFALEIWCEHLGVYRQAMNYTTDHDIHAYRQSVLARQPNGGKIDLAHMKGNPTYFTFKIVMNPYHRAVTAFEIYVYGQAEKQKRANSGQHNMSFLQFLRKLQQNGLKGMTMWDVYHVSTQATGVCHDQDNFKLICKLEGNLEQCLSNVNKERHTKFALPPPMSHVNDFHHFRHKNYMGVLAHQPWTNFDGVWPEWENFYRGQAGEAAAKLVNELYRCDFESYGYDAHFFQHNPTSS